MSPGTTYFNGNLPFYAGPRHPASLVDSINVRNFRLKVGTQEIRLISNSARPEFERLKHHQRRHAGPHPNWTGQYPIFGSQINRLQRRRYLEAKSKNRALDICFWSALFISRMRSRIKEPTIRLGPAQFTDDLSSFSTLSPQAQRCRHRQGLLRRPKSEGSASSSGTRDFAGWIRRSRGSSRRARCLAVTRRLFDIELPRICGHSLR